MSKFESFYLLKRSDYGAQNEPDPKVSCANFTEAVQSIMIDSTQNAEKTVNFLFKIRFGPKTEMMYLSDVKAFLDGYDTYF